MPIYEYACKACGHEFEREQRISEAPVRKCPACNKQQAKRLISRTSFLLKGGGWYSDLYASNKGGAKDARGGEAEAAKGEGAGAEKTEKAETAGKAEKPAKSDKAASAGSGGEGKPSKKPSGGGKAAA